MGMGNLQGTEGSGVRVYLPVAFSNDGGAYEVKLGVGTPLSILSQGSVVVSMSSLQLLQQNAKYYKMNAGAWLDEVQG